MLDAELVTAKGGNAQEVKALYEQIGEFQKRTITAETNKKIEQARLKLEELTNWWSCYGTNKLSLEEVTNTLKQMHLYKSPGPNGHIPLKFDISKAYDRVEWSFLGSVLTGISLHPKIVSLITLCVNSIMYSFLPNDAQSGYLHLEVSDKVTLYPLYLFFVEAFSALIHIVEGDSQGQGVAISRLAPRVSHLLFVDDTRIFC
ncbi:hypothetical protein Sango_1726800 [Sesamum angolense]|uniref:Reverse transcriptase domain-containing protein n=1 Tax=Sesamum angolense TaxID=2727404 RepID=A0AAE1WLP5_9LAMI|nr:hypothetical protein Sango_1726800 [Sesamum angolense]